MVSENDVEMETFGGSVLGLAYLAPKPVADDQGYAEINGLATNAKDTVSPAGEKAIPKPVPVGSVLGLAYLAPKPVADDHG